MFREKNVWLKCARLISFNKPVVELKVAVTIKLCTPAVNKCSVSKRDSTRRSEACLKRLKPFTLAQNTTVQSYEIGSQKSLALEGNTHPMLLVSRPH